MQAMDQQEQRSLIHFLAKQWKECSRELMAYQYLARRLEQAGSVEVQKLLDQARHSPELPQRLDEQFAALDAVLPPPDPDHSERVKELIAKWKPKSQWPN
jgi:uncharacterized protein with von Willebrand factor type A (vWA) domain